MKPTMCYKVALVLALFLASGRANAQSWSLTGNAGTNPSTNFLGTTDNRPLIIKANNNEAMRIGANGKIGIGTPSTLYPLSVGGHIGLMPNTSGQLLVGRFSAAFPYAYIIARSSATNEAAGMIFRTYDAAAGGEQNRMIISSNGKVGIGTNTPTQTLDVRGTGITFRHTDGNEKAFLDTANGGQSGAVATLGPNGQPNAVLFCGQNSNHGAVALYDAAQNAKAYMLVDTNSRGWVVADVKSFRVPNSKKPDTDIVYASIEGPEAAAYVRGTARLVDGKAVITFPDHFMAVASPKGMTVQLTPLSADSLGLGVVDKNLKGLVVKELRGGKGSYEFDWEVKAIRKGYEDYQAIRPHSELMVGQLDKGR